MGSKGDGAGEDSGQAGEVQECVCKEMQGAVGKRKSPAGRSGKGISPEKPFILQCKMPVQVCTGI